MNKKKPDTPKDNGNTLQVFPKSGQTDGAALATAALDPTTKSAQLIREFSKSTVGELHLMDCIDVLKVRANEVHGGNLLHAESLLVSQAHALDALFCYLANRSKSNIEAGYLDSFDRMMRLALKAQGQCRATLETLAVIKNPPVVYANQANIAQGPQQVNNTVNTGERDFRTNTRTPAHAENSNSVQNELLEDKSHETERVDFGTASTAGRGDPAMATVDEIHRPADV